MGDEGDFHQGILDILYATEVFDEEVYYDDFLEDNDDADSDWWYTFDTAKVNMIMKYHNEW